MDPDRESSTSLIDAAFIKPTSDNDERANALENQLRTTPNRKERKKSKMPKRKRKKDDGSKEDVKYIGVYKRGNSTIKLLSKQNFQDPN